MRTIIGQQGEVAIFKIKALPDGQAKDHKDTNTKGQVIISHSESGNHHVLERPTKVFEATDGVADGMRKFYAIVDEANALIQDAGGNPHEKIDLEPGVYEFRISREFDPFSQQARQVAD
jgi:hypothetical protein